MNIPKPPQFKTRSSFARNFGRKKKKQKQQPSHRSDLKFKEVRRLLARRERERQENTENIVQEL